MSVVNDSPSTRPSLLLRIRDSRDGEAWSQFVEIYAPLIYGFARRQGLQDADAADLTQEVLRVVPSAAKRLQYDSQRDSFRGWLFTVARNKLRDFVEKSRRNGRGSGKTSVQGLLSQQAAPEDAMESWNKEYEEQVFAYAAEQVRREVQQSTWQAFWKTAVEGRPGKQVADQLGMSLAAVYLAKSRVIARLKENVQQVTND